MGHVWPVFLDTNVISELMRREPDASVMAAARPMFEVDLAGRVLPFDTDAASIFHEIASDS